MKTCIWATIFFLVLTFFWGCGGDTITESKRSSDLKQNPETSSTTTSSTLASTTTSTTGETETTTTTTTIPEGNASPQAEITSPVAGVFAPKEEITFSGGCTDPEDGEINGDNLVWTSSLDGEIGTGKSFSRNDLSAGTSEITLTCTDSKEKTASTSVSIEIFAESEGLDKYAADIQSAYNTSNLELAINRYSENFLHNGNDRVCIRELLSSRFQNFDYENFQYRINESRTETQEGAKLAFVNRTIRFEIDSNEYANTADVILILEDGMWKNHGNQVSNPEPFATDATFCEDVNLQTGEPINPKNVFTSDDKRVSVTCKINSVKNGDTFSFRWFQPDRTLYEEISSPLNDPSIPDCYYGSNYFWWYYFSIENNQEFWNQNPGEWMVHILVNYEVIHELTFVYQAASQKQIAGNIGPIREDASFPSHEGYDG